ncbi:MAG: aldo/keto reductase [Clostridiales Family XIII bacterium]|nr:aldo/keto reductase [Clostridiales Family XIII bacterium]
MEYRTIKKLDIDVSVVGLGGEHLDGKPYADAERVIHTALDAGVNIMDLFMPGDEIRANIGRAIRGRRDKVMIQGMIGSVDVGKQYDISREPATVRRYFERLLACLDTDYIDFGMLFFIDSDAAFEKVFEGDSLAYARRLKQDGTIRGIGASSHDPVVARRMVETGELDLLMFSVNPAFDMMPPGLTPDTMLDDENFAAAAGIQPDRAALYKACEREHVAVTTMKTLGAGKLLSPAHTPFRGAMTPAQCIAYALDRPAVVSALIGCKTAEEVSEALKYLSMGAEERDYSEILGGEHGNFKGNCVYCNHCLPCPAGIDIAALTRDLDIARAGEGIAPPSVVSHYGGLSAHGSDCTACGHCEKRCPFDVPVIENMRCAAGVFGL